MKKKLFFLTMMAAMTATPAIAQRNGVVLDMETRQPLAGVKVYTNTNKMYMTDRQGHYSVADPASRSVTFSHSRYVNRTVNLTNIKDTVLLLPKAITINTVVITAKAPSVMSNSLVNLKTLWGNDPLRGPSSPSGMNFLWFLEKRSKVPGKVMKKAHEAVEKYTPDPISPIKGNEKSETLP